MNEEIPQKSHQKKIKREYLFYYLGIAVLIIGISLLPLTFDWLRFEQHIPIIVLAIGISIVFIGLLQRQPVDKNIFDTKAEEILKAQEQITDHVIKRIRWFAIIIGVVGVFGVAGYIRMTFDPQLTKINLASGELEQIKKDYNEIRNQKHEIDSLRQATIKLNEVNKNLTSSLKSQQNYINTRIQNLDSTISALPQKSSKIEKILEQGREIDKIYSKVLENQSYELNIHYFESRTPDINRITSELRTMGFKIFLDRKSENELEAIVKSKYIGNLYTYLPDDIAKARNIIRIFNNRGIPLKLDDKEHNLQKARSFDVWP